MGIREQRKGVSNTLRCSRKSTCGKLHTSAQPVSRLYPARWAGGYDAHLSTCGHIRPLGAFRNCGKAFDTQAEKLSEKSLTHLRPSLTNSRTGPIRLLAPSYVGQTRSRSASRTPFRTVSEELFSELRPCGVLRSSARKEGLCSISDLTGYLSAGLGAYALHPRPYAGDGYRGP
jgi:hypothetical protein